jgi:hypothetical protein
VFGHQLVNHRHCDGLWVFVLFHIKCLFRSEYPFAVPNWDLELLVFEPSVLRHNLKCQWVRE